MNVTFHTIGSIATAAVLSFSVNEKWRSFSAIKKYLIGFVTGTLIHGLLDFLPHQYPLNSKFDAFLALFLLFLAFLFTQKQNRLLLLICFSGAVFPDVVDLFPAIVVKNLEIPFPQLSFKIFPWHLKEYSGSIYNGTKSAESAFYHIFLTIFCSALIYFYRKDFLKPLT